MFDVAFSELLVIALVGLIVIGPERLPQVARTAGHMWSRLQRYVTTVKNDISNEMDIEAASKMKQDFLQQVDEVEQEVKAAHLTLEQQILQAHYSQTSSVAPPEVPLPNDTKNNPS